MSQNISKTIIPGIAKVIENFILIYRIEDVIKQKRAGKGKYKIKRGTIVKEIMMPEDPGPGRKKNLPAPFDPEFSKTQRELEKSAEEREKSRRERERWKMEKAREERRTKSASVDIGPMDMNTLSLEPTWVKVDSYVEDVKTTEFIGVKAAPFYVKSDAKFANLLLYDKQVKGLQSLAINIGRKIVRTAWRIWDKIWTSRIVGGSRGTISGDPRKDILLRRSIFSTKDTANVFAVIDIMDLTDDFFQSAGGINKLFRKKGWSNIIIIDNSKRLAHFCMKDFRGVCNTLSFGTIFQRVGQYKVYENLEDIQRSSSSLFKVRSSMKKIMSNAMAKQKYLKYRGR
ncbi:MAG: hypothetical protein PVG65_01105 [Candidatus Thorarchaeota archaeon]